MVLPGPPAPTPATTHTYAVPPATTAFARMNELRHELRRGLSSDVGNDLSCVDIIDSMTCDSAYVSCIESVDTAYYNTETDATYDYASFANAVTSCYCNYGVTYLSCYYSAIERPACASYLGAYDWQSYESYWFDQYCGTVPPAVYATTTKSKGKSGNQAPTSVSLDLQSVAVVTLSSAAPIPDYTYTPSYKSTGNLLNGACASAHFTLLEDASTVYWAAYVGCASDQPQCCPWTAASQFFAATATGTVTVTSTVMATAVTGTSMGLNAYPVAANSGQGILKSCAADYYSISGACCPSSYWPFTRGLGGQTPCYSSMETVTEAPTLTYGSIGQPSATDKPTSAVVNVVWTMSYPVESRSGLSKGAIAGIAVAAVVVVAALGLLAFCVSRYRRKYKYLQQAQAQPQPAAPVQGVAAPVVGQYAQLQQQPLQQPGMVHVQPGYVYPPQQQLQHQMYPVAYAHPANGNGPSLSTGTPASMLAPQSTGTTVSELSGGVNSVSSASGLVSGSPHPASTGSPTNPPVYPAPIAEADETSQQHQHYYTVSYAQPVQFVEIGSSHPAPTPSQAQ